jgi:hypothetical protein
MDEGQLDYLQAIKNYIVKYTATEETKGWVKGPKDKEVDRLKKPTYNRD